MTISTSRNNKLIAEFMGFEKVRVNYFDEPSATKWQKENEKWLEKHDIDEVGSYIVNVTKNKWHSWSEVAYHKDWNWLMPAWFKYQQTMEGLADEPDGFKYRNHLSSIRQKFSIGICEDREIRTCYQALIEGLNYYNSQKK